MAVSVAAGRFASGEALAFTAAPSGAIAGWSGTCAHTLGQSPASRWHRPAIARFDFIPRMEARVGKASSIAQPMGQQRMGLGRCRGSDGKASGRGMGRLVAQVLAFAADGRATAPFSIPGDKPWVKWFGWGHALFPAGATMSDAVFLVSMT